MATHPDLFDIKQRVTLVTGASSGLGRHFARLLASRGAMVGLCARRVEPLEALARELNADGESAMAVPMDVTDSRSVANALATLADRFGPVEVLVNNSGIAKPAPALEVSEADWASVIETNLSGAWRVARATAQQMVDSATQGSIINIASVAGLRVVGALSSYTASKAGLIHLTHALAVELARFQIRVNAIAPGYILTEMNQEFFATPSGQSMVKRIPQRRIGQPEDLDGVLLLLASSASAYMTGSVVSVDGGHSHCAI